MSGGNAARHWCLKAAQWAAAVLWLLTYDDGNAHRVLQVSGDLIVLLARSGEPTIRFMAMGVIVRLVLLPTTMHVMLTEYRAIELLTIVGNDQTAADRLRLMCTTTLAFLARADGTVDTSVSRQLEEENKAAGGGLETVLMALVKADGHVGLQTVGCRRLALLALGGRKKCRAALAVGATQAVTNLLKQRAIIDGAETLWCLQHPELCRLAINALLNLSIEPSNQLYLARHAVRLVQPLVCAVTCVRCVALRDVA